MSSFKFVGGTGTRTHEVEWPVRVQAFCIRRGIDGVKAKDIFVEALALLNQGRVDSGLAPLSDLPKSYTKYAASLLWGIRTRFANQLGKGSKVHQEAAAEYELPAVVETEK